MDTSTSIQDRDVVIKRVMRTLARIRAFEDALPVKDSEGVAVVHIALPEDRVGAVGARVHSLGGAANVILAYPEHFSILCWDGQFGVDIPTVDVHEDSTMDMLRVWLDRCNGSTNLRIVTRSDSSVPSREIAYSF